MPTNSETSTEPVPATYGKNEKLIAGMQLVLAAFLAFAAIDTLCGGRLTRVARSVTSGT